MTLQPCSCESFKRGLDHTHPRTIERSSRVVGGRGGPVVGTAWTAPASSQTAAWMAPSEMLPSHRALQIQDQPRSPPPLLPSVSRKLPKF